MVQVPLISYALRWLERGGIDDVILCANPGSRRALRQHVLGESAGLKMQYCEDRTPRGPAGCVKDAAALSTASTLVVADATTVPTADLQLLLADHWSSGAALTLAVHKEPGRGGAPCVLVPGGLYIFERRVLELVGHLGFQDIKEDLIPRLHSAGELVVTRTVAGSCPRVLNAQTYLAVNQWIVEQRVQQRELPTGYVGSGDIMAHVTARIDADAILVGPVVVGPGAVISSGATVIGPTVVGRCTQVARGAMLSRSVAWEHCFVGAEAVLDRSVLATHAAVPAGARVVGQVWALRAQESHVASPRPRRSLFPKLWPTAGQRQDIRPPDPRRQPA